MLLASSSCASLPPMTIAINGVRDSTGQNVQVFSGHQTASDFYPNANPIDANKSRALSQNARGSPQGARMKMALFRQRLQKRLRHFQIECVEPFRCVRSKQQRSGQSCLATA
jgi:hypothetical protein